jgi:AcrR family transcriptional regulator
MRDVTSTQRHRLLEAAGETFAEHGFHAATVRRICLRARANVAAIKYHFGDKAGLYHHALLLAQGGPDEPAARGLASAPAEQRLRALIGQRLLRVFDDRRPAWHDRLLSREMIDPTPALDALVGQQIRPRCEQLQAIVRELLGARASQEQVRLSALSIIGQCLFYYHARSVLERLFPKQTYGAKEIDRLAEHITQFSLVALRGLRGRRESNGRVAARRRIAVSQQMVRHG